MTKDELAELRERLHRLEREMEAVKRLVGLTAASPAPEGGEAVISIPGGVRPVTYRGRTYFLTEGEDVKVIAAAFDRAIDEADGKLPWPRPPDGPAAS